jgi:hypothetical protein
MIDFSCLERKNVVVNLRLLLPAAALAFFVACAPSAAPSASDEAIARAPFRTGEVWSITAISTDGKLKRVHSVEITGKPSYDEESTEVYIDAKSGTLEALTYYDPDTEQQAVEVFLDKNKDRNLTWCDFNDARRGVTQLNGVSYFGLNSKLGPILQNGGKLGTCVLQKVK